MQKENKPHSHNVEHHISIFFDRVTSRWEVSSECYSPDNIYDPEGGWRRIKKEEEHFDNELTKDLRRRLDIED